MNKEYQYAKTVADMVNGLIAAGLFVVFTTIEGKRYIITEAYITPDVIGFSGVDYKEERSVSTNLYMSNYKDGNSIEAQEEWLARMSVYENLENFSIVATVRQEIARQERKETNENQTRSV